MKEVLNKAYQGLKLLFDPASEGNPYIRDVEKGKSSQVRRPFFVLRKMSWR